METLNAQQILATLPHRYPFLLVDRVVERVVGPSPDSKVGCRVKAIKNVTFNEPYFPGHFPEIPVMPGVIQIEAMAQAAALAFLGPNAPRMEVLIASVDGARFRRPVTPGDTLLIQAEIVKEKGSMIMAQCECRVDHQLVAEAKILAAVSLSQQKA